MEISKPTVIVSSIGRTGTTFYANLFDKTIPDCMAVHEPDSISIRKYRSQPGALAADLKWKMKFYGLNNVLWRKLNGTGIRGVSDRRISGRWTAEQAQKAIFSQRVGIDRIPEKLYVESNYGFYGLIDITPKVYSNHRLIYIVRDGREWVRSQMTRTMFAGNDIHRILGTRLSATMDPNDPYTGRWGEMSRFDRLCWSWRTINQYALATMESNPHARFYRFEDLFQGDDKVERMQESVRFCLDMPGIDAPNALDVAPFMSRKVNKGEREYPSWPDWTEAQKAMFRESCADLMGKLGYDDDLG